MEFTSISPDETKKIAAKIANNLKVGEWIYIRGEIGAGKTTFVQGLASFFGVEDPIRSPTFTIVNHYRTNHSTIKEIIHIDFYRLKPGDTTDLGLEDFFERDDIIVVIEWPDKVEDIAAGRNKIYIDFTVLDNGERQIIIN
jgi:tRNA threonylcarbamoyladenosine biosynthesis protein TsaE